MRRYTLVRIMLCLAMTGAYAQEGARPAAPTKKIGLVTDLGGIEEDV